MIFVGDCRLFTVDADVEAGLCVSYTFKLSPTCSSVQLAVGLTFSRPPTKRPPTERPPSQLWLTGARADCSQLAGSSGRCLSFTEEQVVGSWTTRSQLCLSVIVYDDDTLMVVVSGRVWSRPQCSLCLWTFFCKTLVHAKLDFNGRDTKLISNSFCQSVLHGTSSVCTRLLRSNGDGNS